MRNQLTVALLSVALLTILVAASTERPRDPVQTASAPVVMDVQRTQEGATADASAVNAIELNWYSINSGGTTAATSPSYRMGISIGESAVGEASSASYQVGLGFWYGVAGGAGGCLIDLAGDVNASSAITSADIIYLVNFVFKGGAGPLPCEANGDVNCNGAVTSADIIFLVNFVFKGGDSPCDICNDSPIGGTCN